MITVAYYQERLPLTYTTRILKFRRETPPERANKTHGQFFHTLSLKRERGSSICHECFRKSYGASGVSASLNENADERRHPGQVLILFGSVGIKRSVRPPVP